MLQYEHRCTVIISQPRTSRFFPPPVVVLKLDVTAGDRCVVTAHPYGNKLSNTR